MWTGISHFDGQHYTISKRDVDAQNMSPLDTHKVSKRRLDRCDNINFPLHVLLHQQTGKECCVLIHNMNSSWLAAQNWVKDALPAWDCNCAMFGRTGDVVEVKVPYIFDSEFLKAEGNFDHFPLTADTKVAVLPNRAVAVFGNSVNHAIMRSIYLNFAIDTMRNILATGNEKVREAEPEELLDQNFVWDNNPMFSNANHEMRILKKQMDLPLWWDRVDVSEYSDGNLDELQLLSAVDMPSNTTIATVGGTILTEATKYTVRLAPEVHLHMKDDGGSDDSIFTRLNHSFNPNLKALPDPERECITFKTIRNIQAGEQLTFDYTTTEGTTFAEPFVDLESGIKVGAE